MIDHFAPSEPFRRFTLDRTDLLHVLIGVQVYLGLEKRPVLGVFVA
jgi:hypothetical protein